MAVYHRLCKRGSKGEGAEITVSGLRRSASAMLHLRRGAIHRTRRCPLRWASVPFPSGRLSASAPNCRPRWAWRGRSLFWPPEKAPSPFLVTFSLELAACGPSPPAHPPLDLSLLLEGPAERRLRREPGLLCPSYPPSLPGEGDRRLFRSRPGNEASSPSRSEWYSGEGHILSDHESFLPGPQDTSHAPLLPDNLSVHLLRAVPGGMPRRGHLHGSLRLPH